MEHHVVPQKHWTVAMRINHWAMAISIFVLIGTGFFIADPVTVQPGETWMKFSVGEIRFWHLFFGVLLTFIFIWRIYLAFFSRYHADWKDLLAFLNFSDLVHQIRFYLLLEKKGPPHRGLYGPMQSLAYLGLFGLIFLIIITGLILMGSSYHGGLTAIVYSFLKPVETLLGGLAMVRYIHHLLTWCFVLFIVVHVYMAFWYDAVLKEGTLSSMVSGYMFRKEDH